MKYEKEFRNDEITLGLVKEHYRTGNRYYGLVISDLPCHLQEEFCIGEPWADITVNLPGLVEGEFALDNNFSSFCGNIMEDVLAYLTGTENEEPCAPVRYITSGFCTFPVYRFAESLKE